MFIFDFWKQDVKNKEVERPYPLANVHVFTVLLV